MYSELPSCKFLLPSCKFLLSSCMFFLLVMVLVLFCVDNVFYRLTDMSEDVVFVHSLDNEDASTDQVRISVINCIIVAIFVFISALILWDK